MSRHVCLIVWLNTQTLEGAMEKNNPKPHRCMGTNCRCRGGLLMTWSNMLVNIARLNLGLAWYGRVKTVPQV